MVFVRERLLLGCIQQLTELVYKLPMWIHGAYTGPLGPDAGQSDAIQDLQTRVSVKGTLVTIGPHDGFCNLPRSFGF